LQLCQECRALGGAWRQVAEVVETALADGDELRRLGEFGDPLAEPFAPVAGVMRMQASRRIQAAGVPLRQCQRDFVAGAVRAGDDDGGQSGAPGACEYCLAVSDEALVREVGADVDQRGFQRSGSRR